ncbi:MAG: hypothetical protein ACR2PZ_03350 [Pseudomonadales bacterium]
MNSSSVKRLTLAALCSIRGRHCLVGAALFSATLCLCSAQAPAAEHRVYRCERPGQSPLFAYAPCDAHSGPGAQLGRGVISAPPAKRLHLPGEGVSPAPVQHEEPKAEVPALNAQPN